MGLPFALASLSLKNADGYCFLRYAGNREINMNENAYYGLSPRELWRHFAALNRIPRPSGEEGAARAYIERLADDAGAPWRTDHAGNLVVYIKPTAGRIDAPVVAIQGHLDMVCGKLQHIAHDFKVDPIIPRREENRIIASGTTLGADNGIGVAAALAVLTSSSLKHGPLVLLFTVREESGPWGASDPEAWELPPSEANEMLRRARFLINLDSEDARQLTAGSAGGESAKLTLQLERDPLPRDWVGREISVSGLKGGHSGLQIHEQRGNALKLLSKLLRDSLAAGHTLRLIELCGGHADNAIPRDATAHLAVPPTHAAAFDSSMQSACAELRKEWTTREPQIICTLSPCKSRAAAWTTTCQQVALDLLRDLPHGVFQMSSEFPDKVETSANLAQVRNVEDHLIVTMSARSFVPDQLKALMTSIRDHVLKASAEFEAYDQYPSWTPKLDSPLLRLACEAFEKVNGKPPRLEVVHGGLECGAIVAKFPDLDAISFGPDIENAHTPEECVYYETVEPMWEMLVKLLAVLSDQPPRFAGKSQMVRATAA
jgi:dipeptidase D